MRGEKEGEKGCVERGKGGVCGKREGEVWNREREGMDLWSEMEVGKKGV